MDFGYHACIECSATVRLFNSASCTAPHSRIKRYFPIAAPHSTERSMDSSHPNGFPTPAPFPITAPHPTERSTNSPHSTRFTPPSGERGAPRPVLAPRRGGGAAADSAGSPSAPGRALGTSASARGHNLSQKPHWRMPPGPLSCTRRTTLLSASPQPPILSGSRDQEVLLQRALEC